MPKNKVVSKSMLRAKSHSRVSASRDETSERRNSLGTPKNVGYARYLTIPKTNKRK